MDGRAEDVVLHALFLKDVVHCFFKILHADPPAELLQLLRQVL